jgi:hypothetical protein
MEDWLAEREGLLELWTDHQEAWGMTCTALCSRMFTEQPCVQWIRRRGPVRVCYRKIGELRSCCHSMVESWGHNCTVNT